MPSTKKDTNIWSPVFNSFEDIMILIDENCTILNINDSGLKFFDKPKNNIIGHKCEFLLNNSSTPKLPCFNDMLNGCDEKININNSVFKLKSLKISNKPDQINYLFTLRDITSEEYSREAIIESNKYLESLFRAAPTGMGVVIDRIIYYVNDKMCSITEYSREELLHQSSRMLYTTQTEYEKVGKIKYSDIKKYGTGSIETKWVCKSGKIIDIFLSSSPIDIKDYSKGMTFTALDITNLISTEKELMRSEQKYRKIIESANDAIIISDIETGLIIDANKKTSKLLGLPVKKIIGLTYFELYPKEFQLNIKNTITKDSNYGNANNINESYINNTEHGLIPVEVNSNIIKSNDGKNIIIAILRDISERKRNQEELNSYYEEINTQNEGLRVINEELVRAKNKAEESTWLKSAFLANMSHEIRTPMNGIIGFSSLLNKHGLSDNKREEYFNIVRSSCSDLLHIVDDILDISIIESGLVEIIKNEFCLNELLRNTLSLYKQKIISLEKNINIQVTNRNIKNKFIINTDEKRLKQIIYNLVDNSIKFTESGSITISYKVNEDYIRFSVSDTGIGIDPRNHVLIFERFRQTEESNTRKYGGNGLGLAICKGFVERLGGTIWVESEVGKGSVFNFELPVEIITEPLSDDTKGLDQKEYDWKGKSILIIEDDQISIEFLENILAETNVNIVKAVNGNQALEIFESDYQFDCVLMDIRLPDTDGFELTKQFKKRNKNIPVIAQTAYAMTNDKVKCNLAGCDDYISKPIDRDELFNKIDKILS